MAVATKIGSGSRSRVGRSRRHLRVRKKVTGTAVRPRLVVNRSTRHLFVQVVDDAAGRTLAWASTMEADLRSADGDKTAKARQVGELVGQPRARPRASTRSCSTVAATSITVASRPWPTAPATRAWRSDEEEVEYDAWSSAPHRRLR